MYNLKHYYHAVSDYCWSSIDLGVTWVCVHNLTWHQNDLKVD